jgi:predicted ester cyclase
VIDFDRKTKLATGQWMFADQMALIGQLGVAQVPHREPMTESLPEKGTIAKTTDSDVEKANLAALAASNDAFNKHDLAAWATSRTDDMTFYDSSTPNDVNKAQMTAGVEGLFKTFSDLKNEIGGAIAAGDYVASFGQLVGTNDGDLSAQQKATGKQIKAEYISVAHYKDGKIDKAWRFVNGFTIPMQLGLMK